jgi:hypothetical protein
MDCIGLSDTRCPLKKGAGGVQLRQPETPQILLLGEPFYFKLYIFFSALGASALRIPHIIPHIFSAVLLFALPSA